MMRQNRQAGASDGRSATERSTTSQPRGVARRRAILNAAMKLFARWGYNRVPLADIAAEAKLTQAGLLYHFPTKADLLLAVLEEREAQNMEQVARRRANGEGALEAYFGGLEDNDRDPEMVRLFVLLSAEAVSDEHPAHAWFTERNRQYLQRAIGYVTDAVDVDRLPPGLDAETIARWIIALSRGLGAQWVLDPTAFSRHEQVSRILILLEPYLKTTPQTGARPA